MASDSADQQKYDRQLRLWGVHGQRRLMNCHVCLLNAGPTGTEALKNLVLPGIGNFTVVDHRDVTPFDCTNNFFVDESWIGKSRAEATCTLLKEMNSDVKGNFLTKDPRELVKRDPEFFKKFTLILATQMEEDSLVDLCEICSLKGIQLVIARTYGLIGHVRLFAVEHQVIELKPSPEPAPDLRISNAFPSLQKLADDVDLSGLDQYEFKHVPYVLILLKVLEEWKKSHGGKAPENFAQKEEFKKSIKALSRSSNNDEDNLSEAVSNAFQAFTTPKLRDEINDIFSDEKCKKIDKSSTNFWIMSRGLKEFYDSNKTLPFPGILPDMTATTNQFIRLQKCFSDKAKSDYDIFSAKVDAFLKQIGKPVDAISAEERTAFCSNSSSLTVLKYRSLKEEPLNQDYGFDPMEIPNYMQPIVWYLFWRVCDATYSATGEYPGQHPDASESELTAQADVLLAKVKALVNEHYKNNIPEEAVTREVAQEMIRYGATEVHNIAALIGGIAAEECVKFITHQYQPLDNTYVFNGICAVGKNFQL